MGQPPAHLDLLDHKCLEENEPVTKMGQKRRWKLQPQHNAKQLNWQPQGRASQRVKLGEQHKASECQKAELKQVQTQVKFAS